MYHHPNKIWVSKRILFIPPGPAGLQAALKKKYREFPPDICREIAFPQDLKEPASAL
jgi:hypothetical protein